MAPAARSNFYIWGSWGARVAPKPYCVQKLTEPVRKVCIGENFILALLDNGAVMSWGEDGNGLLGLMDIQKQQDPAPLPFDSPDGSHARICDLLLADKHALALSVDGEVFSWGNNDNGQLGLGEASSHRPTMVDALKNEVVIQIAVLRSSSFALTDKGQVFAWGMNDNHELALDTTEARVTTPTPMTYLSKKKVLRIEVQHTSAGTEEKTHQTMIAYVDTDYSALAVAPVGEYGESLRGSGSGEKGNVTAADREKEHNLLKGVSEMGDTLGKLRDWWSELELLKHGAPFDARDTETSQNALDLDPALDVAMLQRAEQDFESHMHRAKTRLAEVGGAGQKNVRFMLEMFVDACKLRKEKIARARSVRMLISVLEDAQQEMKTHGTSPGDFDRVRQTVKDVLDRMRRHVPSDVMALEIQKALILTLESRLQLLDTHLELNKLKQSSMLTMHANIATDEALPALRIIKERWMLMKNFSLYNLYQNIDSSQGRDFGGDENFMMETLVKQSDAKINQVIAVDKEKMLARDLFVPSLLYDLLMENAELRRMANSYQLKVLIHHALKGTGGKK
jgi:hypothetical protein